MQKKHIALREDEYENLLSPFQMDKVEISTPANKIISLGCICVIVVP